MPEYSLRVITPAGRLIRDPIATDRARCDVTEHIFCMPHFAWRNLHDNTVAEMHGQIFQYHANKGARQKIGLLLWGRKTLIRVNNLSGDKYYLSPFHSRPLQRPVNASTAGGSHHRQHVVAGASFPNI